MRNNADVSRTVFSEMNNSDIAQYFTNIRNKEVRIMARSSRKNITAKKMQWKIWINMLKVFIQPLKEQNNGIEMSLNFIIRKDSLA